MQVGLHQFSADSIEWLLDAVKHQQHTRSSLAQELCERENWRNAKGQLCLAQARKALPKLALKLDLALPAPSCAPPNHFDPLSLPKFEDRSLCCTLEELGGLSLEQVADTAQSQAWRSMMATHHPEGWRKIPGAQLFYFVVSSRFGRLGGLSFHAASWHQKARDEMIGWSPRARAAHLSEVLNNSRFLILPGVRVARLASAALRLAVAEVGADWQSAYGLQPQLVYSYIGAAYQGTCYRAAGWQLIGQTSGRPPRRGAEAATKVEKKSVWMYPLSQRWQERLCQEPPRVVGAAPPRYLTEDADWAEREYGGSTYPDPRIRQRIVAMGRAWEERPGEPVPVIFPRHADLRAANRLLSNENVYMDDILESHQQATSERAGLESVALAVQDTTMLNYDNLRNTTSGLVKLGGGGKGVKGIMAHVCLVVNEAGRPLGVMDVNGTARAPAADEQGNSEAAKKDDSKAAEKDDSEAAETDDGSLRECALAARFGEVGAAGSGLSGHPGDQRLRPRG